MKQTITESMFIDAFRNSDRSTQFSWEALRAIFNYIEEYEADSGEEIELDVIAICCDWNEATAEEINEDYLLGLSIEDDLEESVLEYLEENSAHAAKLENGKIVYVQF